MPVCAAVQDYPIHTAAETPDKPLRTVYLCDCFEVSTFGTEVFELFNPGESTHSLRRAIRLGLKRSIRRATINGTTDDGRHVLYT